MSHSARTRPRASRLPPAVRRAVARAFRALDYDRLGPIYCDEGGPLFWKARRGPCQRLGLQMAATLLKRLPRKGRSLYVGVGIAELPMLTMERIALRRDVEAYTLRRLEASLLNAACRAAGIPLSIKAKDAATARASFDHLWIVSVLNDPERFPELSALSYGRANPATFNATVFSKEQRAVRALAARCLSKLHLPAIVTTSVEEIPWIADWCKCRGLACSIDPEDYPSAIVEDPVCLMSIG